MASEDDAPTLGEWRREEKAFSLLDCRPQAKYEKITVPGATCLPNGEIAHHLPALDMENPIVVTCAGHTRGIVGSRSLARIAPDREVYAVEGIPLIGSPDVAASCRAQD